MHRSKTLKRFFDFIEDIGNFPESAALNAFALPLVESTSSLVAMNEGHIYPEFNFLHAA